MATEIITPNAITMANFKGRVEPDWCPGCGDYGVLAAVQKALVELQIPQHEVATISGIGCSSNFPGFIETYGMHTLHGRSLPVATGVKMANHALTVLVTGGDGDGFGIGCGHFVHAMRRNVDLTYMVMDNQIYGLTTGQTSPTSRLAMKTKTTPFGNVERPVNPIALALAAGATYVARGFSRRAKAPHRAHQERHPAQRLFLPRHLQPLCNLQPRQHRPVVQAARKKARRQPRLRRHQLRRRHGQVPALGRRNPHRQVLRAHRRPHSHRARARLKPRPASPPTQPHPPSHRQGLHRRANVDEPM